MLKETLEKYLQIFPDDGLALELLKNQIKYDEQLNTRKNFTGHIAGDAIILSPDHKKILLVFHLHNNRWQQPGGHWDEDEEGPWLTAAREAFEETGVKIERRVNLVNSDERIPLQIKTGKVMPSTRKNEPQHWHHDFRYGFIAQNQTIGQIQDDGIKSAKWVDVNDVPLAYLAEAIARLQELLK